MNPPEIRYQRVRIEKIYYKDMLCDEFRFSRFPMPDNIRVGRNNAIILAFLEIACCLLSFGFYDLRRSRIILALCVMNCLLTAVGFYAKLTLSYCGLLSHACYSISVIGGFYIYIMIDYALGSDTNNKGALSDTWVLLVSSLPLLGLFGMGIYSCVLAIMLDEEIEQRNKHDVERQRNRKQKFRFPRAAGAPVDNEAFEGEETRLSSKALDAEQHVIEVL